MIAWDVAVFCALWVAQVGRVAEEVSERRLAEMTAEELHSHRRMLTRRRMWGPVGDGFAAVGGGIAGVACCFRDIDKQRLA